MSGDQKRDEALTGLLGAVSGATAGREDPSALIQALQRALERLPGARVAFSHRDAAWARREFGIDGAPSAAVQDALCAAAENFGPDDEPDLRYLVEDHLRLAGAKAAYEDEPGGLMPSCAGPALLIFSGKLSRRIIPNELPGPIHRFRAVRADGGCGRRGLSHEPAVAAGPWRGGGAHSAGGE